MRLAGEGRGQFAPRGGRGGRVCSDARRAQKIHRLGLYGVRLSFPWAPPPSQFLLSPFLSFSSLQGTGPDIEIKVPEDTRLRFIIDTLALYVMQVRTQRCRRGDGGAALGSKGGAGPPRKRGLSSRLLPRGLPGAFTGRPCGPQQQQPAGDVALMCARCVHCAAFGGMGGAPCALLPRTAARQVASKQL